MQGWFNRQSWCTSWIDLFLSLPRMMESQTPPPVNMNVWKWVLPRGSAIWLVSLSKGVMWTQRQAQEEAGHLRGRNTWSPQKLEILPPYPQRKQPCHTSVPDFQPPQPETTYFCHLRPLHPSLWCWVKVAPRTKAMQQSVMLIKERKACGHLHRCWKSSPWNSVTLGDSGAVAADGIALSKPGAEGPPSPWGGVSTKKKPHSKHSVPGDGHLEAPQGVWWRQLEDGFGLFGLHLLGFVHLTGKISPASENPASSQSWDLFKILPTSL